MLGYWEGKRSSPDELPKDQNPHLHEKLSRGRDRTQQYNVAGTQNELEARARLSFTQAGCIRRRALHALV